MSGAMLASVATAAIDIATINNFLIIRVLLQAVAGAAAFVSSS